MLACKISNDVPRCVPDRDVAYARFEHLRLFRIEYDFQGEALPLGTIAILSRLDVIRKSVPAALQRPAIVGITPPG
jgi:hypothetical protein